MKDKNKKTCTATIIILILAIILIPSAQARAINKIIVIVRDSTGNPVEGAQVIASLIGGDYHNEWRTDEEGKWVFVNAPVGNYTVKARHAKGKLEVDEAVVYVDGDVTVNLSLMPPENIVTIETQETKFVISELVITPAVVDFGEEVSINYVVSNIGDELGFYNIAEYIEGPWIVHSEPKLLVGITGCQLRSGKSEVIDGWFFTPTEQLCSEGIYNVSIAWNATQPIKIPWKSATGELGIELEGSFEVGKTKPDSKYLVVPPPPSIEYLGFFLILLIGLLFLGPVLSLLSHERREKIQRKE